ncbi:MAG TPA: GNAT family N-acetyltransferase [Polyangiaceae bacterium]|nr:GNAT family N-acetyltransferase [Polyangiaceae bacterium]
MATGERQAPDPTEPKEVPPPPLPEGVTLRDARDDDAAGLIELIGGVFAEYPGCILDVDGELPELRAIATAFQRWGGRFWVVEREGRVIACVGFTPSATSPDEGLELRKLYVEKAARKMGLGRALCAIVESAARSLRFVELWSDTRFENAHALYARRGYTKGPETRDLHDKSGSVEYYFRLNLEP